MFLKLTLVIIAMLFSSQILHADDSSEITSLLKSKGRNDQVAMVSLLMNSYPPNEIISATQSYLDVYATLDPAGSAVAAEALIAAVYKTQGSGHLYDYIFGRGDIGKYAIKKIVKLILNGSREDRELFRKLNGSQKRELGTLIFFHSSDPSASAMAFFQLGSVEELMGIWEKTVAFEAGKPKEARALAKNNLEFARCGWWLRDLFRSASAVP